MPTPPAATSSERETAEHEQRHGDAAAVAAVGDRRATRSSSVAGVRRAGRLVDASRRPRSTVPASDSRRRDALCRPGAATLLLPCAARDRGLHRGADVVARGSSRSARRRHVLERVAVTARSGTSRRSCRRGTSRCRSGCGTAPARRRRAGIAGAATASTARRSRRFIGAMFPTTRERSTWEAVRLP